MKVTLTVQAGNGQLGHVDAEAEAEAETYEKAKATAETLIPEGSQAIASSAPVRSAIGNRRSSRPVLPSQLLPPGRSKQRTIPG